MKKRLISLLLTLSIVFSMVPMLMVNAVEPSLDISEKALSEYGKDIFMAYFLAKDKLDSLEVNYYSVDGAISVINQRNAAYNSDQYDKAMAYKFLTFGIDNAVDLAKQELIEKKAYYATHFFNAWFSNKNGQLNTKLGAEDRTYEYEKLMYENIEDFADFSGSYTDYVNVIAENDMLDITGMSFDTLEYAASALKNYSEYNELLANFSSVNMSERSFVAVLELLKKYASPNGLPKHADEAIQQIVDSYSFSSENFNDAMLITGITNNNLDILLWDTSELVFSNYFKVVDDLLDLTKSGPLSTVTAVLEAQKFGEFVNNTLFETDAYIENLFNVINLGDIVLCLRNLLDQLKDIYIADPFNAEKARLLNAAYKMTLSFIYYTYDHVETYIKSAYRADVTAWIKKVFGSKEEENLLKDLRKEKGYVGEVLFGYETEISNRYRKAADEMLLEKTKYIISYDANGGTGAPYSQIKKHNSVLTLTSSIPSWSGHKFIGWTTSKNGNSLLYKAGTFFTLNSNTTLYAQWAKKDTITYNAPYASNIPAAQENTGTITLPSTTPKRNGYDFLGWSESQNDTDGKYYKPGETCTFGSGSFILYAIWKPKSFNVIFDAAGGKFPKAGSSTITKTKEYNQAFVIDIEAPEKSGCTFAGKWVHVNGTNGKVETYDHDALKTIYSIGDSTLDAKTLTAVWINNNNTENIPDAPSPSYTIQYNANVPEGVTVKNLPSAQTKTVGTAIALSSSKPTRTGYTFLGWNTSSSKSDASDAYAPGSYYSVDANLTLYAIWKQNTVSGTGISGDINADKKVNNKDLIALRLYIDKKASKPLAVDEIQVDAKALDVNGNGKSAEEADFDTLMKYLTNWDVDIYYGTGKLAAPEGVAAYTIDYESISVSWYAVEGAEEYEVYRSTSRSSGYKCVATISETEYIDTGLNEDTKYYYKIKACAGDTRSDYSSYDYATTDEGIPVSFSATHPDHGELVDAGNIEVWNGKATMTWTINSSHAWEAETSMSWCYFDSARTERETSGSAGKSTLKIYLKDSQTSSKRTGKVKFTVNGETFTVTLMQKKAQIDISHPDYPDVIDDQPIHLFNNANISMNWTVDSTHDWSASVLESSSNWVKVQKTSDTNLRLTTLWYTSGSQTNTATIAIYVNGDVYEIEIYQN